MDAAVSVCCVGLLTKEKTAVSHTETQTMAAAECSPSRTPPREVGGAERAGWQFGNGNTWSVSVWRLAPPPSSARTTFTFPAQSNSTGNTLLLPDWTVGRRERRVQQIHRNGFGIWRGRPRAGR